jgi:dihydrofolate synthase/folylpolyglutamate synthase
LDSFQAIKFIYDSYVSAASHLPAELLDIHRRHPQYCRELLEGLGLDRETPPTVLITGSKGKGSTSAMLAGILGSNYERVGLFTGPHLMDFCERIRLNGRKIPEADFVRLVEKIKPLAQRIIDRIPQDHYLGPVGMVLAVALLWYQEEGSDFHVVECGRGGLSDDTNVLINRWSVMTPVMLEHPRELGPTVPDIAANKLGIVKGGQQVLISYQQEPEVARLVESICRRLQVPLKMMGRDFRVEPLSTSLEGTRFRYWSGQREGEFVTPLAGGFQAYNAAVAMAAAEEIVPGLANDAIQSGLGTVSWPGRCEYVPGEPPVILDGAINTESASLLAEVLKSLSQPLYLVTAVPQDKDWRGLLKVLAPICQGVWLTQADNPHLVFPKPEEVVAEARQFNHNVSFSDTPLAAMEEAARHGQGVVVVAGTQSLVRDAKVVLAQWGRQ